MIKVDVYKRQDTSIKMENSLPCGEKAMPDLPASALSARAIQLKNFARLSLIHISVVHAARSR